MPKEGGGHIRPHLTVNGKPGPQRFIAAGDILHRSLVGSRLVQQHSVAKDQAIRSCSVAGGKIRNLGAIIHGSQCTAQVTACRKADGCDTPGVNTKALGIFPNARKEEAIEKLEQLGFPFTYLSSVVEAALHNPNLIVHTVGAIMSIPRIEKTKGEYCMYHEVFTPSVWRILEQLDSEKMDVLEKLGFERLPYVEACKFRNSLDDDRDAKEVFFWYAAMPTRAKGPIVVDSRYIAEDVPQGLVMLEALGKQLGVPTPITTSLIELATAALGRDMREEGRSPEKLGTENIAMILKDCGR